MTFAQGLFVVVGHNGSDFGSIYTSPDGVVWTSRHRADFPNPTIGELRKVLFANGRFVAVGWNFAAYVSENGIDWTGGLGLFSGGLDAGFADVCYGQGKYVAIDAAPGASNILTSVDGLSWNRQRVLLLSAGSLLRVAFGNGKFVAVSAPGLSRPARCFTSTDGIQWSFTSFEGEPYLPGLTWAKGLFVAVGLDPSTGSGVILSSPDAIAWTSRDYGRTNALGQVECINGLFIATGNSVLATSTNGIHWESRPSTNMISRFAYGNGTLVGISGSVGSYWGTDLYQSDPLLSLAINRAHPPELSITGIVGQTCWIDSADDGSANWQSLAEVFLPASPYVWTDTNAVPSSTRLYRGTWRPY